MGTAKILISNKKIANLIASNLDMQNFPQLYESKVTGAEITNNHLVLVIEGPRLKELEQGIIKEEIYVE